MKKINFKSKPVIFTLAAVVLMASIGSAAYVMNKKKNGSTGTPVPQSEVKILTPQETAKNKEETASKPSSGTARGTSTANTNPSTNSAPSTSGSGGSTTGGGGSGSSTPVAPFGLTFWEVVFNTYEDHGGCNKTYHFEGHIDYEFGPGTIAYHWERGDGAVGSSETVNAPANAGGRIVVSNSWNIGLTEPYLATMDLVITSPVSERASIGINHTC